MAAALILIACLATVTPAAPTVEVSGIECGASDVVRAVEFYAGALGFTRAGRPAPGTAAVLENGGFHLTVHHSDASLPGRGVAGVILNIQVSDLTKALALARVHGAIVEDPEIEPFALGTFIRLKDPYGNRINLIRLGESHAEALPHPQVFNVSVDGHDLLLAEPFYTGLGFEVLTRKYVPETLPLVQRGEAMIVLHGKAEHPITPEMRDIRIVVTVTDLESVAKWAKTRGSRSWKKADQR